MHSAFRMVAFMLVFNLFPICTGCTSNVSTPPARAIHTATPLGRVLPFVSSEVISAKFSTDHSKVAYLTRDGLHVVDVETGAACAFFPILDFAVTMSGFCGHLLVINADTFCKVYEWHPNGLVLVLQVPFRLSAVARSTEGDYIAVTRGRRPHVYRVSASEAPTLLKEFGIGDYKGALGHVFETRGKCVFAMDTKVVFVAMAGEPCLNANLGCTVAGICLAEDGTVLAQCHDGSRHLIASADANSTVCEGGDSSNGIVKCWPMPNGMFILCASRSLSSQTLAYVGSDGKERGRVEVNSMEIIHCVGISDDHVRVLCGNRLYVCPRVAFLAVAGAPTCSVEADDPEMDPKNAGRP